MLLILLINEAVRFSVCQRAKFCVRFEILLVQQKSDTVKCDIIPNPAMAAVLVLNIRNFVMFIISQTDIFQCTAYTSCGSMCNNWEFPTLACKGTTSCIH
mgnify:CR=1 FL=1